MAFSSAQVATLVPHTCTYIGASSMGHDDQRWQRRRRPSGPLAVLLAIDPARHTTPSFPLAHGEVAALEACLHTFGC